MDPAFEAELREALVELRNQLDLLLEHRGATDAMRAGLDVNTALLTRLDLKLDGMRRRLEAVEAWVVSRG